MPLISSNKIIPTVVHQLILGCCFLNSLSGSAVADEFDTLQFRANVNKTFDSNLFRRASGEVSEQITTTTLGIKLDKTYSLQRVMLDLSYVDYKYHENDYLNFAATNYSGTWLWSLTPSLTGTLSSERTQSMNSFGDFRNTTKNVRTITDNQFRAQYSPHNVWGVILGLSQMTLENSEVFTAISDFDSFGVDFGVNYQFSSGSSITFLGHKRRGEFKDRPLDPILAFDDGYTESEYELDLLNQDGGKGKLFAKVGYIEREYNNFTIRNYDSYIGYISYELALTGKLKSRSNLSRSIAAFETINTGYSISDTLNTGLTYSYSSKIEIGGDLRYGERDFGGRGQFDTSGRFDKETSYSGYIKWNPTRNIGLSLSTTKSYRNSTLATFDFADTLTYLNVELKI